MTVLHGRESLKHRSQILKDAIGPTRPLIHSKYIIKVGHWNVQTLYRSRNTIQEARRISRKGIDINELTGWDEESVTCVEEETIIYSGRDDDDHREKEGILMS